KIVGTTPRNRIILPLSGISRVSGNIKVVLDDEHHRAFVHVSYDVAPLPKATGPAVGLDWGITEVCTDNSGVHHGSEYGPALVSMTKRRNKAGKARNKLRALSNKQAGSKKARHIARHNLGTKKQQTRLRRTKAQLQTISGAAIKEVVYGDGNRTRALSRVRQLPSQRPRSIITEDLSHLRGKTRSKKISRLCSSWARAENKERMTVHAHVGGSDVKTVNAAYTSQTCPDPTCGYVSSDNRHGDMFHCRNPYWECNWQGDVDHVAAMNIQIKDRRSPDQPVHPL
ncbi:MAG: zinc ribbon domain-containing protein, partial [Ferrimicrobium sp.]